MFKFPTPPPACDDGGRGSRRVACARTVSRRRPRPDHRRVGQAALPHWYAFADGWKRHELTLPAIDGRQPNFAWNVKAIPSPFGRDAILTPVTVPTQRQGALLLYTFTDGAYVPTALRRQDYPHPMDDVIALYDLTGDGQVELLVPDSGTGVNSLHILRLQWPAAVTK